MEFLGFHNDINDRPLHELLVNDCIFKQTDYFVHETDSLDNKWLHRMFQLDTRRI